MGWERKIAAAVLAACVGTVGMAQQAVADWADRDVPYVPTPQRVVDEMLRMAEIDDADVLYDLGSGDGRIVIAAARDYGARGVGIDIDPDRIRESNENAQRAGVEERVRFIEGDLFEVDLSEATAVTLYLLSSVNLRLRPKLLAELAPGTPVVSHAFNMGEWEPDAHATVNGSEIFFWVIPADVAGTWTFTVVGPHGAEEYMMSLEQEFQKVSGIVNVGGEHSAIENAELRGEELTFTLTRLVNGVPLTQRFVGRIQGDAMDGVVEDLGASVRLDAAGQRRIASATLRH